MLDESKVMRDNPKDMVGSNKLPMHLWPTTATAMGCLAMLNGAEQYGRGNFRAIGVRASVYQSAAKRYLDAWFEGEENDPKDGVPHLAAALACIAIIVDARVQGKLIDDRMYGDPEKFRAFIDEITPHVRRLKEFHKNKNPKHWTIADSEEAS